MKPSERKRRDRDERREQARAEAAQQVGVRPWFALAIFHLVLAATLALLRANGVAFLPGEAHVIVAVAACFLAAGGLAYGFAPPFLKRAVLAPALASVPLAALLAGEAAMLVLPALGRDALAPLMMGAGAAFLFVPLHLGASAAFGPEWRGGVALFAKDQPFRRGDVGAAAAFGLGLLGLALAGVALLYPPRGLATTGLALAIVSGLAPFLLGVLLFLLPRNAKSPMPGLTLVGAALGLQAYAGVALALGFARPLSVSFRFPAAALALAYALVVVATLRLRFPEKPGPQLVRARPFLNGGLALGALASVVTFLALVGGLPNELLPLAAYAHVTFLASCAVACALLGAPILLNAVPRPGRWGKWSAALAILGLFLVAPAFQYARPAAPGAAVVLVSTLVLLWGVAPMRKPRRECD